MTMVQPEEGFEKHQKFLEKLATFMTNSLSWQCFESELIHVRLVFRAWSSWSWRMPRVASRRTPPHVRQSFFLFYVSISAFCSCASGSIHDRKLCLGGGVCFGGGFSAYTSRPWVDGVVGGHILHDRQGTMTNHVCHHGRYPCLDRPTKNG